MRALLLAALIASPAIAEIAPRPVGPDPRIRSLAYDPDEVFRLNLAMKFITHIRFAPGEAIQSVSVGDSASWQIVRLPHSKPLPPRLCSLWSAIWPKCRLQYSYRFGPCGQPSGQSAWCTFP